MARSIWTGSVNFGLVNIPVKVFSAVHEHDVHFHQLAPDGSRIHYERVSEKTGKTVEYQDINKGFETSKGHYVVFETDELAALAPAATKTIDIEDFVALDDIDPVYFDRTYHLAPDGDGAARAYSLLAAVMDQRSRVGIGKVVMREKQHLAAIRPFGAGLALSTMVFADEVVAPGDIDGIPEKRPSTSAREKELAGQILDTLASDWKPERYHDDYEEQLRALIKTKESGGTIEAPEPVESAKVLDLMEALRASLDAGGRKGSASKSNVSQKTSESVAKKPAKKTTKKTTKKSGHRVAKKRTPAKQSTRNRSAKAS